MYVRYVGNHFSWSNSFLFGRGITETPYFHKGEPLQMVPKLPLSAKKQGKTFFSKQLYLGNKVTERQNCTTPPFNRNSGIILGWHVTIWDESQVKAFPNTDHPHLAILFDISSLLYQNENHLLDFVYMCKTRKWNFYPNLELCIFKLLLLNFEIQWNGVWSSCLKKRLTSLTVNPIDTSKSLSKLIYGFQNGKGTQVADNCGSSISLASLLWCWPPTANKWPSSSNITSYLERYLD